MDHLSRRAFLKTSALGTTALAFTPMTSRFLSLVPQTRGELVLRPYPHPLMPAMSFAYATDENDDPFKTSLQFTQDGIVVPEHPGQRKIAVNTRWYVEGFGYIWLAADNGGACFSRDDFVKGRRLNLNHEFARSRVHRGLAAAARHQNSRPAPLLVSSDRDAGLAEE